MWEIEILIKLKKISFGWSYQNNKRVMENRLNMHPTSHLYTS
jgi:hypothetical protein